MTPQQAWEKDQRYRRANEAMNEKQIKTQDSKK